MTEIDRMPPGELAAAVAREVLGLKGEWWTGLRHEGGKVFSYAWPEGGRRPFAPWERPDQVLAVIEAMLASYNRFRLTACPTETPPETYSCCFPHEDDWRRVQPMARGPFWRAVCGAALAAARRAA